MRIFEWNDAHAVHVPEVDDEHRQIFRLCNDLQRAMMAGAATAEIQSIVEDLVIHTAQHLSHEEREMREAGYSLYGKRPMNPSSQACRAGCILVS